MNPILPLPWGPHASDFSHQVWSKFRGRAQQQVPTKEKGYFLNLLVFEKKIFNLFR